ncbi:DUF5947 family protein [Actinomadura keratinilytica]|uniref:DUF5947 family protein n=1 Tax=Actinomadura keratinilytica TaxID=547461 RepID=A0ABP7ZEN5_9ACTN
MTAGALQRAIRRRADGLGRGSGERCDLCGAGVPDAHAHLLDERQDHLLCACRACGLLFEREAAGRGHYLLVPDRRVRLSGVPAAELGVPVGLAFFVRGTDGAVRAHYPSPAGATRCEVDPGRWRRVAEACEPLRSMRPAVEALLVNTVRGADEQWLVPIDECYRLVAVVRGSWKGLSGGREVWPEIDRFFAGLAGRGGPRGAHRHRAAAT